MKKIERQKWRSLFGKSIYDITFHDYLIYEDPRKRRFLILHGDQFDPVTFQKNKGLLYKAGDTGYTILSEVDWVLYNRFKFEFSIASLVKRCIGYQREQAAKNSHTKKSRVSS